MYLLMPITNKYVSLSKFTGEFDIMAAYVSLWFAGGEQCSPKVGPRFGEGQEGGRETIGHAQDAL